jgi:hypothetical protein
MQFCPFSLNDHIVTRIIETDANEKTQLLRKSEQFEIVTSRRMFAKITADIRHQCGDSYRDKQQVNEMVKTVISTIGFVKPVMSFQCLTHVVMSFQPLIRI